MPRVSVVVSHYDRRALLLEALDSIAAQRYRDFEVVVVNDHGPDCTELVAEFAERHGDRIAVRDHRRSCNGGVAATRNAGIALASGELIAYLDDDDLWRPDALERLVGALDDARDAALVYGDAEIWHMTRTPTKSNASGWRRSGRRTLAVPFDLDRLRQDDFVVPGGMLHRRSLFDAVGPYDESLWVSDDWDWLLRAVRHTAFEHVPHVVVTVRIWADGSNLSAQLDARRLAALREIERRHGTPPLEPKTFWEVAGTYAAAARVAPRRGLPALRSRAAGP